MNPSHELLIPFQYAIQIFPKDLENKRKIKTEIAKQFFEERWFDYFTETSAIKGDNVFFTFAYAANLLLEESLKYMNISKRKNNHENKINDRTDSYLSFNFVEDEPSNIILKSNKSKKNERKCCNFS